MDWSIVVEVISGIFAIGLIGMLVNGMYLLEKDKQERWKQRRKEWMDKDNGKN